MSRVLVLLYGLVAYAVFFVTFLWAIGFVDNLIVPNTIDSGAAATLSEAILVNVGILALFAIQHTIMARRGFKAWWTRIIPPAAERSTFVLITSAILLTLFWQWRPLPAIVWDVQAPAVRTLLTGLSLLGFVIVLYASFLINHFDLFGLRQVVIHARGREYTNPHFAERSLYKLVRHPLMTGFLLAFWAAPTMTQGHLLFALVTTGYILFGITIEERDLVTAHGDAYRDYRKRTPALLPIPRRQKRSPEPVVAGDG